MSLRKIAEEVGCAMSTVRSHLQSETWPGYQRKKLRVTKLSAFENYLRERQLAAHPAWIPATVLLREIKTQGYLGRHSQLRAFMHGLKPTLPVDPVVRFETAPGEQMQVDWVEFRKGMNPLYAFCATLGFSRASFVEFVTDMKAETLIACHQHAFDAFGGIPKRILYDNMKTVVIARDALGDGAHRFHAGFLDYAHHCGFVIKLCRPYRAKTKGKVKRFNGYLRRSFYVPLVAQLKQAGLSLDFGLLTADEMITADVSSLFTQITGLGKAGKLKRLWQSPFTLHGEIIAAIENETRLAEAGKPDTIIAKMNALLEPHVIAALYAESQAGVKIDLIVRSVCALRPR